MERKLAAIMAADIAGYSLLMAENEASTYTDLRTVFEDLIDPTIVRRPHFQNDRGRLPCDVSKRQRGR